MTASPQSIRSTDPTLPIERVDDPATRETALSLLLTGRCDASAAVREHFLNYAQAHGITLDHFWLARRDDKPVAALLLVPGVGATAMVFVSPLEGWRRSRTPLTTLVGSVLSRYHHESIRLAQTLLEPTQQAERQALEAAGFRDLASLLYMRRAADQVAEPLDLPEGFTAHGWSEANRPLFERVILATYEQTRDCPGLIGLRSIDDILAGHQGVGDFRPEGWTAVYQGQTPAAVLLLNRLPAQRAVELVYLGVSPEFRRQGLGGRLLRYALSYARRQKASHVILAVDEANGPAVELYRAHRFVPQARKQAMVYVLEK